MDEGGHGLAGLVVWDQLVGLQLSLYCLQFIDLCLWYSKDYSVSGTVGLLCVWYSYCLEQKDFSVSGTFRSFLSGTVGLLCIWYSNITLSLIRYD